MKKLMMLLAFCGLTSFAMAQENAESYPTLKHRVVTNGFWDNWFIDLAGTHLSFYSDTEHGLGVNKNPFWKGRDSWGGELSIGKWATPVFGMRLKTQAAWGTQVISATADDNETFKQINFSLQPMVNLTNLFGGYKPRIWDISLYGGFGGINNFEDESNWSMLYSLGVYNTINVTKRFHIVLDAYLNTSEDGMDGVKNPIKRTPRIVKTRDVMFNVALGIGVNLGKVGWDNAPDMDAILANHKAQLDALNASIAGLEAENAALKNKLANQKPASTAAAKEVIKTVTELKTTSASVFFNINESKIASKKDLVNVKELAELAKSEGKKVVVTGYADSKTGSPAHNQTLSEKRAQAVADAIVAMGVSRDNIEVSGQGGVADLDPYAYNRRAVVSLK